MAKNSIRDYSATASQNTDINSIDIDENCPASNLNNSQRALMAHLKDVSTGTVNLETPAADRLDVDNIRIDGNTISSTDTNGDITLDPNGSGDIVVAQVASSSLDIEGDRTDAQVTLKGGSAGAGIQLFGSTYTNYAGAMYLDATASTTGTNDAQMVFRTGSSPSEAMRIDRSGNVGIGTNSPVCNLHVKSSGNAELRLEETGGDIAQFVSLDDEFRIGAVAANKMTFRTGNTERMRIMPSGRMEFQTPTAETGVLQGQRLDWRNENNAGIMAGIGVVRTAGANAPGAFVIRTSNDVDSTLNNSDGNISEKFRVAPNGDLTATDTSISSNSDQRLKENIADFEYDLTKFKQFQTRTFDWKQPHLHGDRSDVRGFIAQELEAVDSYWVQEIEVQSDSEDYQYLPDRDLAYGPNNNYKPDDADEADTERTARFAKTSRLGQKDAMYVSVIQQLLTKIETLETEMTALKARVTALEA